MRDSPENAESVFRHESVEVSFSHWNIWWALKDLNLRPTDYESAALTAELRAPAIRKQLPGSLAFPLERRLAVVPGAL